MEAEFSVFHAILLGVVQGIAEYLPISSSAHLILVPRFLGVMDPGLGYDVLLHVGTFFATVTFFWREWVSIVRDFLQHSRLDLKSFASFRIPVSDGRELPWYAVAVATAPALMMGALLHSFIKTVLRGNGVMAIALVVGGVTLYWADRWMSGKKELRDTRFRDYLWVGIAQCFALIPGVSRSGSTLIGGRLLGFSRDAAAKFSFLISAPVTLAAIIFELRHWEEIVASTAGVTPLLAGMLAALVSGWIAIGGLLKFLRRFSLLSFAVYRVFLAAAIGWFLGFG